MILPAAYRYQGELAATAASLKAVGKSAHMGTLDTLTDLVGDLEEKIAKLEGGMEHHGNGDVLGEAKHFQSTTCCRP